MRVRMKERASGSDDRVSTRVFEAGQEYDIGEELAAVFLREGWAKKVEPARQESEPIEERAAEPPEDKAIPAAPSNKGRFRR